MIVQLGQVKKAFGAQVIFDDMNFEIKGTEKIALVGRNGSGKTTLLNLLSGKESLDAGVFHRNQQVTIGYLQQMAFDREDMTLKQAFESVFEDVKRVKHQLEVINDQLLIDPENEKLLDQLAQTQEAFERLDGYTIDSAMKTLLTSFGFTFDDLQKPLNEFSGGQKTRLAFIQMLLKKPDVLLLDEPTNHLDIATIEWLENYLSKYPKAIVLTSHDRLFLDHVCQVVVELEDGKATRYKGNYTHYLEVKKAQQEKQQTLYEYQQKDIQRLEALIEKFRYKKNKAAFAQSKIKYLEKMERIEPVKKQQKSFQAVFKTQVRGGKEVLLMESAKIGYEQPLFEVSFKLLRQQRLAVIGPNGCGKSTLLKSVVGQLPLLGGEMLLGHQIKIGYFRQDLHQFDETKTVLQEVWDRYPHLDKTQIRTALAQFLFKADEVFKDISVLSGGEKVRLSLLILLLEGANFLVLDEPTNHLDLESKQALEEALKEYNGTLLFVSHDRYFIQQLATHCLKITDGSTEWIEMTHQPTTLSVVDEPVKIQSEKVLNQDYQQSIDRRKLRKQIEKLEMQIAQHQEVLDNMRELRFEPEYYHDVEKMNALDMDIDDAVNALANLEKEWLEIAQLLEKESE